MLSMPSRAGSAPAERVQLPALVMLPEPLPLEHTCAAMPAAGAGSRDAPDK
jgi:hypothetical protein